MADPQENYALEIERLRKVELGNPAEIYIRLVAVGLAGVLIWLHTGWISSLFWAAYYLVALMTHSVFIATRGPQVSRKEILVAAMFFANQQVSYTWLPVVLFTSDQRDLILVGGVLIAIQLLFIVRRSDTLNIYNIMQMIGLFCMGVVVYIGFLPDLETPLALAGAALVLVGLNFFFWQNLRLARRIRIEQDAAATAAHQAQKLAAIGQLAGGVAHDFNNNLTAIIGSLEILQMINRREETAQDVENALVAARQAAKTVKQLLLFARAQSPSLETVELDDFFRELRGLIQRLIPTSVQFRILHVEPDLFIRADRNQLLTGMINLVVNGVDAMPQGGVLELEARRVQIPRADSMLDGSVLVPGTYARIALLDTGHGIPPHILNRVIEPFFTTKPVGKGTGLGLSMVAGMVREFGGGLSIQSEPGRTLIILFIPLQHVPRTDMRE